MLLKFDISEAYSYAFSQAFLTFYTHQGDNIAYFDIYETDSFDEETVTFNTAPDTKSFVKRFSANACCDFTDLSEYVKHKVKEGKKEICLCITCDKDNPVFKDFSSTRKSVESKRICLQRIFIFFVLRFPDRNMETRRMPLHANAYGRFFLFRARY